MWLLKLYMAINWIWRENRQIFLFWWNKGVFCNKDFIVIYTLFGSPVTRPKKDWDQTRPDQDWGLVKDQLRPVWIGLLHSKASQGWVNFLNSILSNISLNFLHINTTSSTNNIVNHNCHPPPQLSSLSLTQIPNERPSCPPLLPLLFHASTTPQQDRWELQWHIRYVY